MRIVALIPARAGSKRIPRKNIKDFCGHPLIAYTIAAAQQSGIFDRIVVSSDDEATLRMVGNVDVVALHCPQTIAHKDADPDFLWVRHAIGAYQTPPQAFAILRPTSPFRMADTIRRAWAEFKRAEVHSLRAVEPVKQHPGKMWTWPGPGYPMKPLLDRHLPAFPYSADSDVNPIKGATPWHSSPTQSLPPVYVQNASLEMAWTYVLETGTISGTKILPFFTKGYEGVDLNDQEDWDRAEALVRSGAVTLPFVGTPAATPAQ